VNHGRYLLFDWPAARLLSARAFSRRSTWSAGQHDESSPFFDKPEKLTVSGVHRGEQRARYDRRRKEEVPRHGLTLVIVRARDLVCDRRGQLLRGVANDPTELTRLLHQSPAPTGTGQLERLPQQHTHVSVRKNYADPVVRRVSARADEQTSLPGSGLRRRMQRR
jgi:hypothetical protein